MTIPYFNLPEFPKLTKKEVQGAISGKYRFNPDKFVEVVRSCPGVELKVKEWYIESINECGKKPDGSIDVFLSGFIIGKLMSESNNKAINSQLMAISNWIKNLDRLEYYIVDDED